MSHTTPKYLQKLLNKAKYEIPDIYNVIPDQWERLEKKNRE